MACKHHIHTEDKLHLAT